MAVRISNRSDEAVAISRLSVKAWIRDTAPADAFQASTFDNNQTIYNSSGQWVANVPAPQVQFVALGSLQDCGVSRTADKAVKVAFSGSLVIPAGGYLETNPGSVLAGWHRQSWATIDRTADYSRVQDAGGNSAGRSDIPHFGLFVDSGLACEWKSAAQQDAAGGRQPCTGSACDATSTPTPTPTPTTTGTFTFPGAPAVPGACGATPHLDLKVRQVSASGNERVYRFQVLNRGSQPIALNALRVAFWGHEGSPLQGDVYWAGEVRNAAGNWDFNQIALGASVQATAECAVPADLKANQQLRFSSSDARSIPAGGAWVDIQVRVRRADYGSLSSGDDYSQTPAYQGGQLSDQTWPTVYGDSDAFVLYHQGVVVQERTALGVDPLRGREPACLQSCVEPIFGEVILPGDGKTSGLLGALEARPELADSPLVASDREIVGTGSGRSIGVLVKTNDGLAGVDSVLEQVLGVSGDIVAGRVRLDRLDDLRLHPNVLYARESALNKLSMDRSRVEIGQAAVEADPKLGSDGSGVRVAVVDSGIDWCHADFKNPDGSTRIRTIWDQTLSPLAGETPGPGGLGVVYSRAQIDASIAACNTALGGVRSIDVNGHGTHVASTAAGQNALYRGVAPGSELVIVKTNLQDSGITAALSFIRGFEAPQGLGLKSEVTNLSLGSHYGAHDGSDLLSLAVDSYQGAGGVNSTAVVAAGNEGNSDIHAQVTAAGPYVDLQFAVFVTAAGQNHHVEVWLESGASHTGAQVITPLGAGPVVAKGTSYWPASSPHDYQVVPQGLQAQNCQERIELDLVSNVLNWNTWTLRIYGTTPGRLVDAWISSSTYGIFNPAIVSQAKTLGVPGANRAALTVASYVNKPIAGAGGLSTFSSRGPLRAIYRSDAGGEGGAWAELAMTGIPAPSAEGHPRAFITRFALSPAFASDQTVFAAFFGDAGIWKSVDGGGNWTQSLAGTSSNFEQLTVSPSYATDQRVWAKAMHGPLLRSDNGGGTWASKQAGLPVYPALPNGAMGALEAKLLPTGTLRVFASGWDATLPNSNAAPFQNYFAHSDDGGDTWVVDRGVVSATPGSGGNAPLRAMAVSPRFVKDGGILVGLSTENGGIFVGLRRLQPSGPSNWVTEGAYIGDPVSAVVSLAISPSWHEDATVYAGTDGGLYVDPLQVGPVKASQAAISPRSSSSAKTLGWHVEALSLEPSSAAFEPGEGVQASLSLTVKVPLTALRFTIKASDGTVVEEHAVADIAPGVWSFAWDGMDGSGQELPAGAYTLYVTAQWGGIYAYRSKATVTLGSPAMAADGAGALSSAKVDVRARTDFRRSGLGRNILAPSPVPKGQPLCLFPEKAVLKATWRVFGLDGSMVAQAEFEGEDQCMDTSKLAKGLYVVVLEMKGLSNGTQREIIKVVVR